MSKLEFMYDIGDAVLLSDGRRGIITQFGIYNDQYWCEIANADGINLAAADWFSVSGHGITITQRLSDDHAATLARQLKAAVHENYRMFGGDAAFSRYAPIDRLFPQHFAEEEATS